MGGLGRKDNIRSILLSYCWYLFFCSRCSKFTRKGAINLDLVANPRGGPDLSTDMVAKPLAEFLKT